MKPLLDCARARSTTTGCSAFEGPASVPTRPPAVGRRPRACRSRRRSAQSRRAVLPVDRRIPRTDPFEFQEQFDLQPGRRAATLTTSPTTPHAQKVVNHERGWRRPEPARRRIPRNPGDLATPLLAGAVGANFLGQGVNPPAGQQQRFTVSSFIGDSRRQGPPDGYLPRSHRGGAPAIVFTGGHGAEGHRRPAIQQQRQGALVTQEWSRGLPLQPDHYFSGEDLPADAQVRPMAFVFALRRRVPGQRLVFNPDSSRSPSRRRRWSRPAAGAARPRHNGGDRARRSRVQLRVRGRHGRAAGQLLRTPVELLMKGHRSAWRPIR